MKKIISLTCVFLIIVAVIYYAVNENRANKKEEEDNLSIKFSGEFTKQELEKIMGGNLSVEEIKNIVGEEKLEIKKTTN